MNKYIILNNILTILTYNIILKYLILDKLVKDYIQF